MPASPLPASRMREPSLTPAGMLTRYFLSSRMRPAPSHVWHGFSITVPAPPQRSHGRVMEKRPWPWDSTPRPWQTGQTTGVVPGSAPVPRQVGQRRVRGHGDGHLRALHRLLEGERDGGLEVAPALRGGLGAVGLAAARAEDPGQDVREGAEVGRRGPAAGAARGAAGEEPAAVVALALLGVREHVVGLGDLLEALLRAGLLVLVRVVAARELAVRLLDVVLRRLLVDAEGLVVVGLARHLDPAPTGRRRPGRAAAPCR